MNPSQLASTRLKNQHITNSQTGKSAGELVSYMGALQAQDFNMAKWAVATRLSNATEKSINLALDRGEILRTHLLRPTWHFVSAEDIYWMLELTAPQILRALNSRNKQLELSEITFTKSNRIIEKALMNAGELTREELVSLFKQAGIDVDDNRASHLLLKAELDGLICSGATGKKVTYALLEERVPEKKRYSRDEALAKLALKYFTSHGPATLQDFVWWSGLSVKDAKNALEMAKEEFISETFNEETYWTHGSFSKNRARGTYLLPAFDEYIIGYKNRSAVLTLENHKKAVSNNGIFWPVAVINGEVAGLWKRTVKKDKVDISINLFTAGLPEGTKSKLERSAQNFGRFLGLRAEVRFS